MQTQRVAEEAVTYRYQLNPWLSVAVCYQMKVYYTTILPSYNLCSYTEFSQPQFLNMQRINTLSSVSSDCAYAIFSVSLQQLQVDMYRNTLLLCISQTLRYSVIFPYTVVSQLCILQCSAMCVSIQLMLSMLPMFILWCHNTQ